MYIPAITLEKELQAPGFADYERGQIIDCRWSRCGNYMAGITFSQCAGENTALVWNYETSALIRSFMDEFEITELAWAPGRPTLALVCYDFSHPEKSRAMFYDVPKNRVVGKTPLINGITCITSPSWSYDSRYLAISGGEGEKTVIIADNGAVVHQLPNRGAGRFLWNPYSLNGAICGACGIDLLDFEGGRLAQTGKLSIPGGTAQASWSPSGDCLASLSNQGEICIWDSRESRLLWQCEEVLPQSKERKPYSYEQPPVSLMSWSPCGGELFVSAGGREVLVISTEKRFLLARLICINNAVSISISRDGEWCAVRSASSYGENGQVEIWRQGEWSRPLLKPLTGDSVKYREYSRALEFHPEEPLLASFHNGSWCINVWRIRNRL